MECDLKLGAVCGRALLGRLVIWDIIWGIPLPIIG